MVDLPILRIVCGPNALAAIIAAAQAAWAEDQWVPDAIRRQMNIAIAEIAANIVEHAGRMRTATVEMRMRILLDHVEVDFVDNGIRAHVDLGSVAMPDELAERGRGLAIAKAILAQLSYSRTEVGNHWRLVSLGFQRGESSTDE